MSLPVDSIDAVFRSWDTPDSPGCALGIVHDGALAYTRGYGLANLEYGIPITPASVFHVASVSKQFTAAAIALLAREGKLTLDDDVRRYVPELPAYSAPITLRHLILHTSGLRDQWDLLYLAGWREADLKTNADVLALARTQREVNFRPGTAWAYSNTGYTLLALVVERVTGQSLRAYADAALFQPLGMAATHFHDNHREVVRDRAYAYAPKGDRFEISIPNFDTVGATSLFTTVEDLARWATNLFEPRIADRDFIAQLCYTGRPGEWAAAQLRLRPRPRRFPRAAHGRARRRRRWLPRAHHLVPGATARCDRALQPQHHASRAPRAAGRHPLSRGVGAPCGQGYASDSPPQPWRTGCAGRNLPQCRNWRTLAALHGRWQVAPGG